MKDRLSGLCTAHAGGFRFQQVQGLDAGSAILWDGANRLLITRGGGNSFTPAAAPPAQSGGYGFFFTSAETGWFARNSQLYTTANGGRSWEAVPLPEHWTVQGVTAGPDGRVWASVVDAAATSQPSMLLTLASGDGGKTWTRYDLGDFNQPWPVGRCGLSAICVDSGGGRYSIVSHDNGQTWQYFAR